LAGGLPGLGSSMMRGPYAGWQLGQLWVPDEHVAMRQFCDRLGEAGVASNEISVLAVTTQTTIDHHAGTDLTAKLGHRRTVDVRSSVRVGHADDHSVPVLPSKVCSRCSADATALIRSR
jgi:hypothetical protein